MRLGAIDGVAVGGSNVRPTYPRRDADQLRHLKPIRVLVAPDLFDTFALLTFPGHE